MNSYPLLIWPISDGQFLGQIIGTPYTVVDSSHASTIRSSAEYLSRAFKLDGVIEPPNIDNPVLKIYNVSVQMMYRSSSGLYPLPGSNRISVAAVHGDKKQSEFGQCFLPMFDDSFHYYDHRQLRPLLEHFIRSFVENLEPETAMQYRLPAEPTLAEVNIQVSRSHKSSHRTRLEVPELLNEVTDKILLPAAERRALSHLPEIGFERDHLATTLADTLLNSKDNIILIGEQGVGKTTLWNDTVKKVNRETKGDDLPLTIWRTTSQRLISKAKYLGQWQQICDEIIEDLRRVNGILWITDIANLVYSGGESHEDSVAAYLQSYIAKGQLRLIGEMQPRQIETIRAQLPGFIRYFNLTTVYEMEASASARVLHHYADYAKKNLNITVAAEALNLSFQLVARYIKYERSPGKHVRFFKECIKQNNAKKALISHEDIISNFTQYTGLPEILLRDDIALSEEELLSFFSSRIKGQNQVLQQLCSIGQTFKAGLNDPDKPIATLLFAGPTGVGKTAATKALSTYFFEAGQKINPLFRLDMSEFQHPEHIERLIGDLTAPSKLVQHVRKNPFSVILLDEIEKAHQSIFDALLTVFDEGILTDRFGRVTDFRSSIIVMTSNLGAGDSQRVGFFQSQTEVVSTNAIRKYFRPEFFNRFDDILSFQALSQDDVLAITRIELEKIHQRDRIKESGIKITFSDSLIEFIATTGFSPQYGARPIQRAIEKHVVRELSTYLLKFHHTQKIKVDVHDNQIRVSG